MTKLKYFTSTLLFTSSLSLAQTYKVAIGENLWTSAEYKPDENIWNFHWPFFKETKVRFIKNESKSFFPSAENCKKEVDEVLADYQIARTDTEREIYLSIVRGKRKDDFYTLRWFISPFVPYNKIYIQERKRLVELTDGNDIGLPGHQQSHLDFEFHNHEIKISWSENARSKVLGTRAAEEFINGLSSKTIGILLNGYIEIPSNLKDFACDLWDKRVEISWKAELTPTMAFPTQRSLDKIDLQRIHDFLHRNDTESVYLLGTNISNAYLATGYQLEKSIQASLPQKASRITQDDFYNIFKSVYDRATLKPKKPQNFNPESELHRFETSKPRYFKTPFQTLLRDMEIIKQ